MKNMRFYMYHFKFIKSYFFLGSVLESINSNMTNPLEMGDEIWYLLVNIGHLLYYTNYDLHLFFF